MSTLPIGFVATALLATTVSLHSEAKPCETPAGYPADTLVSRANVALGIPGTRRVTMDPSGSCLEIDVSSAGTARLVALVLRALDVPRNAVRFQVVS